MRTLTSTLITAQKSTSRKPYLRLTFSLTGETDVVIEQDRILMPEGGETDDSQTAEIIFDNTDGYFTDLDFKGWQVVIERGLETTAGVEYDSLPALKVMSQDLTSAPLQATCTMSFIGIPNLLGKDKASAQYLHHWSDTKTVKALITEIASGVAVDTELTESQEICDTTGSLTNLTGTATGSPVSLVPGITATINITGNGTFTVVLPSGSTGTAASGTATVTSGPVSLVGGTQTIAVTGAEGTILLTISGCYRLDDTRDAVGQLVYIDNRTVTKLAFKLKKVGSPAGTNVTFRMDDTTGSNLASKTFPIASITTSAAWCEVTLTTPVLVNATSNKTYKVWIYCLTTAGTATDYVAVSYSSLDVKTSPLSAFYDPNENIITLPTDGGAGDMAYDSLEDCAYRYKYTATGIGVFSHCTAYTVTYDSEDSLIDTYAPADGFRIEKNSSRLDAINTLLQFTGCVKRVEADEQIHVFVPTTAVVWTSPTGFTASDWANEANAYDTDTGTYAGIIMTAVGWTAYLELTHAALTCDEVEFYALQTGTTVKIDIDVYDSVVAAWVDVYEGTYTESAWNIKSLDRRRTVTKVRTRFYDGVNTNWTVYACEVYFGAYDYTYTLEINDHEFFAKSIRKALVDPNKITVSTFPDDDTAYSGSYTDSVSYAILPIEEFRSTKLTSDAQGTAIATAMIGQAVLAAQRGTATVPINLGAEIWDYVKVTDSRMSDSRVGNLGYIKWWYRPGQDFSMTFSFSKVAVTGIGAFRPSKRGRVGFTSEEQISELYDNQDAIAQQVDDQTTDIDYLLEKDKAKDVETSVNTQIGEKQIGLLRNIVEDLSPQLGGDLSLNGKNIDFPTTLNISDVKDEDDMASNSATMLATQQSIKAYVDTSIAAWLLALSWTDVSGAKTLGTEYTNGSAIRIIQVSIKIVTDPLTLYNTYVALVGPAGSVTKEVGHATISNFINASGDGQLGATIILPPAYHYIINNSLSASILTWLESDLTIS